jgi:hypothetical protein
VIKRDSQCPLCGAAMTPADLIEACSGLLNLELGVLTARCPHCQGHFEIQPGEDQIAVGYSAGVETPRFDVAYIQPSPGLRVERLGAQQGLTLTYADRTWVFSE